MNRQPLRAASIALLVPAALVGASLDAVFAFDKRVPVVAAVWLPGAPAAPAGKPQVTQKDKVFSPGLVLAPKGSTLAIANADNIQHNVFTTDREAGASLDHGMSEPGREVEQAVVWEDGVFVRFGCRIHPQMQLWVGSIASSRAAAVVIDRERRSGSAAIADVADGSHTVRVWLPQHEAITVAVDPGTSRTVDLMVKETRMGTVTISLK